MRIRERAIQIHRAQRHKRGGALVAALLMVVVVSVIGASFLQLSNSITRRREHANDTKQAMYLAEAGLAEAYIGMGVAKTGNVGSATAPAGFGNGLFWVEATDLGAGRRQLQSTGMWGAGRATLGLVAELVETNLGESGLFMVSGIEVNMESLFDSYDSSKGTYAEQLASGANNDQGHVGSNAEISINGAIPGTLIHGDVTPGLGFGVSTQGTVSITGSTTPRAAPVNLPPVEEPAIAQLPAYEHNDALPLILASGDSGYESLRMRQDTQLYIMGPARLQAGSLLIDQGAEVILDVSGGSIDIYVSDELSLEPGATITNTANDPTQVTLQVSGAPSSGVANVRLNASTSFYGTIYAPSSLVSIGADFELFGGIMAGSVELDAALKFHRDLALASAASSLPRLLSWRVLEIPDGLASNHTDPFKAMGVDPSTLLAPASAHQDQQLVLSYMDALGMPSTYAGWESAFDWGNVSEVVSAARDGVSFGSMGAHASTAPEPPAPIPPPGTPGNWIDDTSISSGDLAGFLIDASPLTGGDLNQAMMRTPPMDAADLMALLAANYPITGGNLNTLITTAPLSSIDIVRVLVDNFPINTGNLNSVILSPRLSDADLRDLLVLHSPLPGSLIIGLNARLPAMNPSDHALVMAAQ